MHIDMIISDNQYLMLLDVLGHADIDREDSEEFNEIIGAMTDGARKIL
jgi:hypothetical protein